jgi:hypothetical protein
MLKKDAGTKALAMAGTALAWFPILAPFALGLVFRVARGWFRFDYLMPAEFFPSALVGGGLLLWVAIRVRSNRRLIGWSLAAAVCMLVGGQALAVLTGLASGESEPVGYWWALVVLSLVVHVVSMAVMGAGGIRLLREQFSPRPQTGEGS